MCAWRIRCRRQTASVLWQNLRKVSDEDRTLEDGCNFQTTENMCSRGESHGQTVASKIVMSYMESLERHVGSWPEVSIHPHRFGGRDFRHGSAEIGHIHPGGIVDIPFPRPVRDALLDEHLAEEHPWVPNSGWVTFRVRTEDDLQHAMWLLRLSYLRYALKMALNPRELFEREIEKLRLNTRFRSLLEPFIQRSVRKDSDQTISA